jgi:hypothetical protein
VYPYILGHFAHPPLQKLAKVKLKKRGLETKPGYWTGVFTNPVVLGAVLTSYVAIGTAAVTLITGMLQRQLDQEKFAQQTALERAKYENSLVIQALQITDPEEAFRRLNLVRNLGLLRDIDLDKLPKQPPSPK